MALGHFADDYLNGSSGSGSDGGNDLFIVHATSPSPYLEVGTTEVATVDKTYDEILSALLDGKGIIAIYDGILLHLKSVYKEDLIPNFDEIVDLQVTTYGSHVDILSLQLSGEYNRWEISYKRYSLSN